MSALPTTRAERELLVLREVAGAVNASLDLLRVVLRVLEAMRDAFDFQHSLVLLPVDAPTDRGVMLEVRASLGFEREGIGARVAPGEGPVGVVAKRRKLLRMTGVQTQRRYVESTTGAQTVPMPGLEKPTSLLVVPMLANDELVGVLSVESEVALAFEPEDERLLTTVANLAAAAIRNARLYHELVETHRTGERFVPHEFVRFLDKQSLRELARGERVQREMTVMFSDLRAFTSLVENLDPHATFELLHRYFASMVPPIQAHRGFVDKFIGDAIRALFDDPHADGAVQAALAELAALAEMNARDAARPPLAMGIGLHRGPLMLGVVGSDERLSCTVYGDSVNLASRVESLTRLYGARLLVTGAVVDALAEREAYALRCVDVVRVKGKQESVAIWEPLVSLPETERATRAPDAALTEARAPYLRGDFAAARVAFDLLAQRFPEGPVVALLSGRTRGFLQSPPRDWDGAYRLDHK
jgi:adenylate cyclase